MAPRRVGMEWLKPNEPERKKQDGHYPDGGGLWLQVSGNGANKSWYFRYEVSGRKPPERRMGLGSLNDVTLKQARDEARRLRNMRATDKSVDPLEIRKAEKEAAASTKAKQRTVRQVVEEWIEHHRIGLEPDWPAVTRKRLSKYVYRESSTGEPLPGMKGIGDLPIKKLELAHGERTGPALDIIHQILIQPATDKNKRDDEAGPLWYKLTRTATIVQGIIKGFVEYALNHGYIDGVNAASMDEGAPLMGRLRPWKSFHKIEHRPALTHEKAAQFMTALREYKDKRDWGRCPVCVSPHLQEIEAIYHNEIVPARQAETARGVSLGHGPNRKAGFGWNNLCERFGINSGVMWLHFNGHPQQSSKEYAERPLSTYALEFIILTGVRKSQTLEVEWKDIDFDKGLQVCPGVRETGKQGHKKGKLMGDHIIVLSQAAIDVLRELMRLQITNGTKGKYVFPKMGDSTKHMARGTCNAFIDRYLSKDFPDITIHGFRTTFKSWSLDHGHHDIDSRLALGHSLGGISNIYGRDASRIKERRAMMNDWADYCGRPSTNEMTDEQSRTPRVA
jgi:Phage integrase family/Arm DNA-binding domain